MTETSCGYFTGKTVPAGCRKLMKEKEAIQAENARLREALEAAQREVELFELQYGKQVFPMWLVDMIRAALGQLSLAALENDDG